MKKVPNNTLAWKVLALFEFDLSKSLFSKLVLLRFVMYNLCLQYVRSGMRQDLEKDANQRGKHREENCEHCSHVGSDG